jgi:hypothetical protein
MGRDIDGVAGRRVDDRCISNEVTVSGNLIELDPGDRAAGDTDVIEDIVELYQPIGCQLDKERLAERPADLVEQTATDRHVAASDLAQTEIRTARFTVMMMDQGRAAAVSGANGRDALTVCPCSPEVVGAGGDQEPARSGERHDSQGCDDVVESEQRPNEIVAGEHMSGIDDVHQRHRSAGFAEPRSELELDRCG